MRVALFAISILFAAPAYAERLHIVFLSATWCGPCQSMREETWSDPALGAWMSEHATFEAVDLDEQPARAAAFAPRGVPTVVVQREGATLDQALGKFGPEELLAWLEDLHDGFVPRLPGEGGRLDDAVRALRYAWVQANLGRCDEALAIWEWVWRRLPADQPVVHELRHAGTGGATASALAGSCPAARPVITALRDQAARSFATARTRSHLDDLLALDLALRDAGDMDAALGALEASPNLRADVSARPWPTVHYVALRERWGLLASVTSQPEGDVLKTWVESGRVAATAGDPMVAHHLEQDLCAMAGYLMAGLLAGGRTTEAEQLGELALRLVDTPFMARMLVDVPLRLGMALPAMERWLDEHPVSDSLRTRLREVLRASGGPPGGARAPGTWPAAPARGAPLARVEAAPGRPR